MSKTVTMTEERFKQIVELTIAKVRAEQSAEAPDTGITNCTVYITNNYGDTYEEDTDPIPVPPQPPDATDRPKQSPPFIIRNEIVKYAVIIEKRMRDLLDNNRHGFTKDAASAKAALKDRFDELSLRLKGDTSLENVQEAYTIMFIQLILAAELSEVFSDG